MWVQVWNIFEVLRKRVWKGGGETRQVTRWGGDTVTGRELGR